MKNKGLIIGISVVAFIILIIIIVVVSRGGRSSDDAQAQAALDAMNAQANDPNTPPAERDSLLKQITDFASVIEKIKNPGGSGSSTPGSPAVVGMSWTPIATSQGLCKNPALLNKTLVLKNGSKGGEVCALQSYLNTNFKAGLVNDGMFGAKTQTALMNAKGKSSITLGEILTV